MAAKTPIRTVYDGSTATGLAEFQTGEFIAVEHGGTGNTSLTANSLLLGNGTSAITASTIQISSNTISSSDADTITIGDNLNVSGNIVATGNITANGDITIGDSATDTVTITADVSSNLIPSADSTYALGASDSAWSNLYTDTITLGGTAITSTAAELNILDGVTATASEINLLDGVTATTTEINYLDGVTSSIQTQIDNIDVSLTLSADSGTNDTFTTGSTLTFTGGSNIGTTVSDDTITIALDANPSVTTLTTSGNATVGGNLDVTGNVTIGGTIDIGDSSADTLTITATLDSNLIPDADATRNIGSSSKAWLNGYIDTIYGNLIGNVTGNLTGNVTGNVTGDVTGNADTATTLATARTIAGQSFDGSANITIAATDLSDTNQSLSTTDSVTFNTVTANLTGTASLATSVTLSSNNTTDETVYLTFADGASGTQGLETDVGLYYNPADNALTTTTVNANVTGNLTGNVTGNVTGDVTGDLTGDVTGTVSSISNHDTDDLSEGVTNVYYTDTRARGALSASGDVAYNSSTGVISFSETYSTAAELLTAIKTVDGAGSGLDADTLDGLTSGQFLTSSSVSPTAFASTSSTAYATSDYGNLTNDTGTAGFVNEPIRATEYQDLALPGSTVSVDFGDLS